MTTTEEPAGPSLAASMPAKAAEFVQTCKSGGVALDFLPRTLPLVDRFMKGAGHRQHALAIAAYLGEVVRRETGGSWYDFEDRALLNVGDYAADPLATVNALFDSGKASEGDVTIESTKAYCELICRMQRLWLDGTVLGAYDSMSDLRKAMTPDARLAGWLVGQTQAAVRTAKMTFEESLDLSSESLDAIERIMSKLHTRTRQGPEAPGDDEITEASKVWGVYVGEVLRRYYGGQWATTDGVVELKLSGITTDPIAKVRKRIVDGPMDNIRLYFGAIPKALSS
jgi:hypothetical protein